MHANLPLPTCQPFLNMPSIAKLFQRDLTSQKTPRQLDHHGPSRRTVGSPHPRPGGSSGSGAAEEHRRAAEWTAKLAAENRRRLAKGVRREGVADGGWRVVFRAKTKGPEIGGDNGESTGTKFTGCVGVFFCSIANHFEVVFLNKCWESYYRNGERRVEVGVFEWFAQRGSSYYNVVDDRDIRIHSSSPFGSQLRWLHNT